MRYVQSLGDWKENRILLTSDNSSKQLVLAQDAPRPAMLVRTRADQPIRPGQ